METVSLPAHFDGTHIQLDRPYELPQNARLIVMLLSEEAPLDAEREDWYILSQRHLAEAYGANEPEYTLDDVKVPNPLYERR